MNLLNELYLIIYNYTDNVDDVKLLRSLCKTSLEAGYDYFKDLLNIKITTYYCRGAWSLKDYPEGYSSWCGIGSGTSFPLNIKQLYTSYYKNKKLKLDPCVHDIILKNKINTINEKFDTFNCVICNKLYDYVITNKIEYHMLIYGYNEYICDLCKDEGWYSTSGLGFPAYHINYITKERRK